MIAKLSLGTRDPIAVNGLRAGEVFYFGLSVALSLSSKILQ
jgi:hypothetical protein